MENALEDAGSDATVTYNDGDTIADAEALAADSDVTVLMIGDTPRETWDKNGNLPEENPGGNASGAPNEGADLDLPSVNGTNQQQLIPRILAANPEGERVGEDQAEATRPGQAQDQAGLPGFVLDEGCNEDHDDQGEEITTEPQTVRLPQPSGCDGRTVLCGRSAPPLR